MNLLRSRQLTPQNQKPPRVIVGSQKIADDYPDYLADESRLPAQPVERLYFPESTQQVCAAVSECYANKTTMLVSGARTGVVGGATAVAADAVISLARLNGVLHCEDSTLCAQAGTTLADINSQVASHDPNHFYPVDPTETSASLGGTIATNASGARSYHFGPTRNWIEAITVVLANGSLLELKRGDVQALDCVFRLQVQDQEPQEFIFPKHNYQLPKDTTGYRLTPNMDAVDLFVGSEGTLGIVTQATIRLSPKPKHRLFAVLWTKQEWQCFELVQLIKQDRSLRPLALEYFDPQSIALLKKRRQREGANSSVPKISDQASAALFLDLAYQDELEIVSISDHLQSLLAMVGLTLEESWCGFEERDLARMKALRHALPETVNQIVAQRRRDNPGLHKLSTDLAVPHSALQTMVDLYRKALDQTEIEYVLFGHIGDSHLHMNMLPKNEQELALAKQLYTDFAKEVVALGGTVAGEHGIGRIKRHLLPLQYPSAVLEAMQRLKQMLDPRGLLNPGVLF